MLTRRNIGITVVALVLATALIWWAKDPHAQEVGQGQHQGDVLSHEQLNILLMSLPEYPGTSPHLRTDDVFFYENGAQVPYRSNDTPTKIITFYTQTLPAVGWKLQQRPTFHTSGAKIDGTTSTRLEATFIKDNQRVIISVYPNLKDPDRGATMFDVMVESR